MKDGQTDQQTKQQKQQTYQQKQQTKQQTKQQGEFCPKGPYPGEAPAPWTVNKIRRPLTNLERTASASASCARARSRPSARPCSRFPRRPRCRIRFDPLLRFTLSLDIRAGLRCPFFTCIYDRNIRQFIVIKTLQICINCRKFRYIKSIKQRLFFSHERSFP